MYPELKAQLSDSYRKSSQTPNCFWETRRGEEDKTIRSGNDYNEGLMPDEKAPTYGRTGKLLLDRWENAKFGNFSKITNAFQGDWGEAGLDLLGVLPFVNEVRHGAKAIDAAVDVGKGAKKAGKALGVIDDAVDIGKTADKVEDIYSSVKTASKSSPSKLIPTHRPTLSRREYDKLLSDIQKMVLQNPLNT